jgi:hypothetical protein
VVGSLLAEQKNAEAGKHFLHASFHYGLPEMANVPILDTAIVHTVILKK